MPSRSAAVVLLLLLMSPPALAQRAGVVSFRRAAVPEDVPTHLCSAIAQDVQGFLWFGTQRGLVRYDGYEHRVFRADPADPKTLGGNYVRALLAARDGRLWVGTFSGGLSMFDPRSETFTRIAGLAYDRVEGLAEDRDGRIWIATAAGLDRLDPRTNRVEHLTQTAVRAVLIDRRGTLWTGTRDGLVRRDAAAFTRVALAGQNVMRLFEDRRGRIWIGTEEHGAAVLDPRSGALHRIAPRMLSRGNDPNGLSHYWVYGFAEAVAGEMWIATFGGGIDVVDEESLAVIDRLRHDPVLSDTIGADRIGALFRDRSGLVWVGTWGEGLARHDPRTRAFRSVRFSPNRTDGLTHASAVRALETRDRRIWAGTNGNGIDVLDRDLKRVAQFPPSALGDGSITCLAESSDGAVWIATLNGSLRVRRGDRFERVEEVPGGAIRTIAFSADGTVWAGAAEGMLRVDPRTLETKVYRTWPGAGESSPAIESIVVARDAKLWIGTDNGLYSFDPRTESATRISKNDGLPDNWVPDLMIARDGRLWVGTASGAAVLEGRKFRQVTRSPAEALIEDLDGNVWIGPRIRVDRRGVREFGPADGVAFRTFFIASRARTRDGRLLFGSPEGLLVLDPRAVPPQRAAQPIVASWLHVEGKPRPIPASLILSPSERSFTLDVASLDFVAPQRLLYRHRLDPLDDHWTHLGASKHSLTYSRLPPGRYTLRAGVTNRDGTWSSQELRLPVQVLPAFHQTPWFHALVALAIAGALYGAYRLRVRRLRAHQRELERLVAERTRELETAYARIEEASLTDPLTGLRNRRYLEQAIDADLDVSSRGGVERDLVILMTDLDHFKSVNDQYGHAAGDAVLIQLADVLRATFRASDHIVRWGGEEFLIVVRFVDRAHAGELAEKLRAAVAEHPFLLSDGTVLRRTCSIGVAAWPLPGAVSWDRAVDLADAALYEAKRSGRDRWAAA